MAAVAVECIETVGTEDLLSSALVGLCLSPKTLLRYDYKWKPTEQDIQECCLPPKVSQEVTSVPPFLQELKEKTPEGLMPCSSNQEATKKAGLFEKELNASHDDTHVILFQFEEERQNELRTKTLARKGLFEDTCTAFHKQKKHYLEKKNREKMQIFVKTVKANEESDQKRSEEARLRELKLQEAHQESAARAVRKVHQVEEWQQQVLEEEEQHKKAVQQLERAFQEIKSTAYAIQQSLESSTHKSHFSSIVPSLFNEMKQVLDLASSCVKECNEAGKATYVSNKIHKYSLVMKNLAAKAQSAIQEAEAKAAKDQERQAIKKVEEMKKQQAEEMKRQLMSQQSGNAESSAVPDTERTESTVSHHLSECISESSFKEYSRLEKLLADACESYEPLVSDKSTSTKQHKFSLQKAVTTPINAISDQSPAHLLDKIQRLTKLLSGQPLQVTGKTVSVSSIPLGQAYCRELLAKKIVQQGSQQVSSSPVSAFPFAALAIGVWSAFPDVGDLILGHFYKACPFLVPFYIPKTEGMSDTEYYGSLGYEVSEGKVEEHDNYLRRMCGLVRLYAAIVSSAPPKGMSGDHPHDIAHGWHWLACVLNLEPRPDYTATALYHFLEVAGHAMVRKYKRQFWKLLLVLVKEYIPQIEKVSSSAQNGPVMRLKGFLENSIKNQNIMLPVGYLTPHWWSSQHNW